MIEKQWETFFDLMNRIVRLPDMTADEKRSKVMEKAEANTMAGTLDEFLSWDWLESVPV